MPQVIILGTAVSIQAKRPTTRYGVINPIPIDQAMAVMLLRTSLSRIPRRATITRARLRIAQHRASDGGRTMRVRRITSSWSSKTTWRTRPTTSSIIDQVNQGANPISARWTFDVTAEVQKFIDGTLENRGWEISMEQTYALTFRGTPADSRPPDIVIDYAVTPEEPDNLHPSSGEISVSNPTLTFDADDEITALEVQIDPEANETAPAWDSGTIPATGGLLDLANPDGLLPTPYPGLAEGSTTYWRVRQRNAAGWSDWSEWAQMTRTAVGTLTITQPPVPEPELLATNLIYNPGDGPTYSPWQPFSSGGPYTTLSSVTEDDAPAILAEKNTDSASLGIFAGNNSPGFPYQPAGTTLTTSAEVKLDVSDDYNGSITFLWRDHPNNDNWLLEDITDGEKSTRIANDGQWHRVYVTGTVKADRTLTSIYIYAAGNFVTGDRLFLRNIMLNEGPLIDFFDGDTDPGDGYTYDWEGEPYGSASQKWTDPGDGGIISDPTPTVGWSFDGVQTAWRVRILNEDGDQLASSGITVGDDDLWRPRRGFTYSGQSGYIVVDVWDDTDRVATPDQPEYVTTTLPVTFEPDRTVDPVDTLEAVQLDSTPDVTIRGTRSVIPDSLNLYRSIRGGTFLLIDTYDALDVFAVGDDGSAPTFSLVDHSAPMNSRNIRYYVTAGVENKNSDQGPIARLDTRGLGVWITDLETGDRAVVWGVEAEQESTENAIIHEPLNRTNQNFNQRVIRRRLVTYQPSGTIDGLLATVSQPGMPTAEECERQFRIWRNNDAGHLYQIHLGRDTRPVIVGDISLAEREENRANDRLLNVSFGWWSQAGLDED